MSVGPAARPARRRLVLALAAVLATTALLLPPAAAAPAAPTISVRPTENLPPNRKIPVTGTGFAPGTTIELRQCGAAGNVTIWRCRDDFVRVNTDAAGRFFVGFKVFRTFRNGVGADVSCRAPKTCVVSARALGTFGEVVDELASTPLHFDPTAPPVAVRALIAARTPLGHLQQVQIVGDGWTSGARVSGRFCVVGTDACTGVLFTQPVRADRVFATPYLRFSREISTALGATDCGTVPAPCELRVEETHDREMHATTAMVFDPTLPYPPDPEIGVTPAVDVQHLRRVTVTGSGFPADHRVRVDLCLAGSLRCETLTWAVTDDRGELAIGTAARRFVADPVDGSRYHDCANDGPCEIVVQTLDPRFVARVVTPIDFAGVPLTLELSHPGPYADHQPIELVARGLPAATSVSLRHCRPGPFSCTLVRNVVTDANGEARLTTIAHHSLFDGHDCTVAPGCEIRVGVGITDPFVARATPAYDPALPPYPQAVTVTPSTGLVAGQGVVVQGIGFEPSTAGAIEQCAIDASLTSCRFLRFPMQTNPSGAFGLGGTPVYVADAVNGRDCRVAPGCAVVVRITPDRVVVPITFAPPP